MTRTITHLDFHLVFLLSILLLSATVTEAWGPRNIFRRGQRLRPVPTNLCVLAGRPRKSSSTLPDDFDNDGELTRQKQELHVQYDVEHTRETPLGGVTWFELYVLYLIHSPRRIYSTLRKIETVERERERGC